jgi:hypothetical protein
MKTWSNQPVETNRRPASPFNAGREFGHTLHEPPFLSAAVAHRFRSGTRRGLWES